MAEFRYFSAPVSEIYRFEERRCEFCGRTSGGSLWRGSAFCLDCLADGRLALSQETELGSLEDGRLTTFDVELGRSVDVPLAEAFDPVWLKVLARTPWFESKQGALFLVHCDDFMRYVGRWTPADFVARAPADPRALYVEIADGDPQLWEETRRERAESGEEGALEQEAGWAYGSWCYVFECLHCAAKRSHWDCG